MTTLPTEAVELYGLEPGEFVAARNALVKQLKRDKRGDDATVIGALRRPSPADAAINAAVRAQPDVATVWVSSVEALDDEQGKAIAGQPNHLREAGAALREATNALVDAAVAAAADERRRPAIIDALRVAATRPGAAMVAAGILGAGDPTDELFAGAPDPPARATPTAKSAKEAKEAKEPKEPKPSPPPRADPPARDTAREERAARAADRLAKAEAAAAAAGSAVAAARAAEQSARDALRDATADLRHALTAATKAQSELAAARRAATT